MFSTETEDDNNNKKYSIDRLVTQTKTQIEFDNWKIKRQKKLQKKKIAKKTTNMDLKRICIATTALLVFLTGSSESASSYSDVSDPGNRDRLVPLVPQQSCYYESYSKRLACVCKSMDQAASLDLKLAYFTYRSGNEIR